MCTILVDTTDACAFSETNLRIALLTPLFGPWILDNEVVFSVTNGNDWMVYISSTWITIDYAGFVVSKLSWVSLDSDSNGHLIKGFFEGIQTPFNMWVRSYVRFSTSHLVLALVLVAIASNIGILLFSFKSHIDYISPCARVKSSIATQQLICLVIGTLNKLLFGKFVKFESCNFEGRFNSPSSCKCITSATFSLISNDCNCTFGSPINLRLNTFKLLDTHFLSINSMRYKIEQPLVLLTVHIAELVMTDGVSLFFFGV